MSTTKKQLKTYRIFTTRHYIAVEWFDVVAQTPLRARNLAEKAAYQVSPDPREKAVDNHWQTDTPTKIERIGQFADNGTHEMEGLTLPKMNEGEQVFRCAINKG